MFSSVEVIFEVLTIKGGWEGGPESGLTINSFALEQENLLFVSALVFMQSSDISLHFGIMLTPKQ